MSDDTNYDWEPKSILARIGRLCRNSGGGITDPASRHVRMMAEGLISKKGYPMLTDEPSHCAGSMLATVANLYAARIEIAQLRSKLAGCEKS